MTLLIVWNDMKLLTSILSAKQFDRDSLLELYQLASSLEETLKTKRKLKLLDGYILASLFFEASTRTRLSFETAMHRLGGQVITAVGVQFSSLSKGESLFDTLKMIESYADVCVIRHPSQGASELAAKNISVPVINGGDGAGEHPTQALLDFYTIEKKLQLSKNKLKISFIGDNKFGRTIHSLVVLLQHFDVHLHFVNPSELSLPKKYKKILTTANVQFSESENLQTVKDSDVLYMTRIQEERFIDRSLFDRVKDSFKINLDFVEKCKKGVIVMHPLPRLSEVHSELDNSKQAVYFEQAKNGVYVRMAILLKLLKITF